MFSKSLSFFAVALALPAFANAVNVDTIVPLKIDSVITDMSNQSEALVIKPSYDWQYKAAIVQYSPAAAALPSWYPGPRPDWCHIALTWYTAYEATGNTSTNTRVEMRNLRMYVLSNKTRKWTVTDMTAAPMTDLWKYPFLFAGDSKKAGVRFEKSGGVSARPAYPNFLHGYGKSYTFPDPSDVRAVYVAMEHRLIVDNPAKADDRAKARYVVNAGADYYPGKGRSWGNSYAPGIGGSKFFVATKEWRTAAMLVPNKLVGATMAEMRTNPPPLQVATAAK